jgi:hypothetical protein
MKANAFLQEENSRYARIHGEHLTALETQKGKEFATKFFGRTFIPQNFGAAGNAAIVEPNKLVQAQLHFQPFQQAEPGTASLPFQPPQAEPVQAPAHTWAPQSQPSLEPAITAGAPIVDSAAIGKAKASDSIVYSVAEDKSADLPTLEEVDDWLLGDATTEEEATQPQTLTCAAGPFAAAASASAPTPVPAASAPAAPSAPSAPAAPAASAASALDSLAASTTAGPSAADLSAANPSTTAGSNNPAGPSALPDTDHQRLFVREDSGV